MREAAAQGFGCVYRLIDLTELGLGAEALPELLTAAERMGFDGLNITHPCKQAVVPLLSRAVAGSRGDGRGEHGGAARRQADRPQHRLLRLRRGLPRGTAGRGAGTGWCSSAPAAPARRWRKRRCGSASAADAVRHGPGAGGAVAAALCARHGAGRAVAGTDLAAAIAGGGWADPCDADRHRGASRPAAGPGTAAAAALGRARSSTSRSRPSCCARARAKGCRTAHGGGMAVFQAVHAFGHFSGLVPDADRMLAHFAEM